MPDTNWWEQIGPVSKPNLLPVLSGAGVGNTSGSPLTLTGGPAPYMPTPTPGPSLLKSSPLNLSGINATSPSTPAPAPKSGPDWGGIITAAAPLLASAFTSGNNPADGAATRDAASLSTMGKQLSSQGSAAMAPVLQYLQAVLSGDPAALMAATQPQRMRILDQYDTARQTMARTAPRGGGDAAAQASLTAGEARDLAGTGSTARNAAVSEVGNIGTSLQGAGAQSLAAATQIESEQARQQREANAGFGKALGGWIATALPLILGAL